MKVFGCLYWASVWCGLRYSETFTVTPFILETRQRNNGTIMNGVGCRVKYMEEKNRMWAVGVRACAASRVLAMRGVKLVMDLSVQNRICVDDIVASRWSLATKTVTMFRIGDGGEIKLNGRAKKKKGSSENCSEKSAEWFPFATKHCIEAGCPEK